MVLSQPDLFFSLPCILLDIFLNSQLSCYDQGFKLQSRLFFWLLMMHLWQPLQPEMWWLPHHMV